MKKNFFEKLAKWSWEKDIDYKIEKFGNSQYFNDDFSVPAVIISFDYCEKLEYEECHKIGTELKKIIKRNKNYKLVYEPRVVYGYYFVIMEKSDYIEMMEHENRIKKSVEIWEQWQHHFYTNYGRENVQCC